MTTRVDRMSGMAKTMAALGAFTAIGASVYWLTVLLGWFPVTDLVPGYSDWFMSFPAADAWVIATSALFAWNLFRGRKEALLFGLLSGSSLIFLGLYALMYGLRTGLIFILTPDELVEIGIKAYCLGVGTLSIVWSWRRYGKAITSRA